MTNHDAQPRGGDLLPRGFCVDPACVCGVLGPQTTFRSPWIVRVALVGQPGVPDMDGQEGRGQVSQVSGGCFSLAVGRGDG